MKTYRSATNAKIGGPITVFVETIPDGTEEAPVMPSKQKLRPRNDLRDHSPDGFQFGYGGSGPAQLSLAILADLFDDATALKWYHDFKFNIIAALPSESAFTLEEKTIRAWMESAKDKEARDNALNAGGRNSGS